MEFNLHNNESTSSICLGVESSVSQHHNIHSIHSIIMVLRPSRDGKNKVRPRFTVNLASLPLELLEKVVSKLDPEDRMQSVKTLGTKFNDICYDVLSTELRNLGPMIYGQLEDAKDEVMTTTLNLTSIKDTMRLVSNFCFLQIINCEYNILCSTYLDGETYISMSVLTYQIIDNLNELKTLLQKSADKLFDWNKVNVMDCVDNLRILNQKAFEMFFIRCWDIKRDRLGPLLIKLLNCALNSTYRVTVSHEVKAKCLDQRCHISGQYQIYNSSCFSKAMELLQLRTDRYNFLKLFLLFICNAIRIENINQNLKIRWDCLDLALEGGEKRTYERGWFQKKFPFVEYLPVIASEKVVNLPNGIRKVTRVIERTGDSLSSNPNWLGMRFDFQLWCPVIDVPTEFFNPEFLEELYVLDDEYFNNQNEGLSCTWPYEFKLDFKLYNNAKAQIKQGDALIENCIWIKESPFDVHISRGKELIR